VADNGVHHQDFAALADRIAPLRPIREYRSPGGRAGRAEAGRPILVDGRRE
jgi:hypothetical protein